jgi:hypothetical protein
MKPVCLRILVAISLILSFTPSAFAADTSAPVLLEWKLLDLETDISNGDGALRIQFSVSDESDISEPLSNVGSTTTTQQTGFAFPKLISKVGNVSTYTAEATVKFGQAPGVWRWLFFPLRDVIGNSSQGFGPGGSWPINVWVYDKDFTEAKRLATEAAAAKAIADANAAAELKAKQEAEAKAAFDAAIKAATDAAAKAVADAKAAAELKAKQEADAKAAADKAALLKAQADLAAANAKAAADREALVKLQADLAVANAKAAADREALVKSQADLAAANASLAAAQKTNRDLGAQLTAIEGQFLVMSDSISTIQSQVLALNTKLTATLKSLSTANAKIKKICSAKPKPKGC